MSTKSTKLKSFDRRKSIPMKKSKKQQLKEYVHIKTGLEQKISKNEKRRLAKCPFSSRSSGNRRFPKLPLKKPKEEQLQDCVHIKTGSEPKIRKNEQRRLVKCPFLKCSGNRRFPNMPVKKTSPEFEYFIIPSLFRKEANAFHIKQGAKLRRTARSPNTRFYLDVCAPQKRDFPPEVELPSASPSP